MKISIVIPMYNAVGTIANCIQSCYQQSYLPEEIIIVDDVSTDNSVAFVQQLQQQYTEIPLILLHNDVNSGVAITRNKGIRHAQYELIAILDCDDIWHPQKLAICVQILQEHPNTPIVFHDYSTEMSTKTITNLSQFLLVKEKLIDVILSNKLQGSGIVFRNGQNILFNEKFRYAEDVEFGIRYVITQEILHFKAALTLINRPQLSAGGLSSNKWQMRVGEMKAFRLLPTYHWKYYFVVPFLFAFSIIKHFRKLVSIKFKR